MGYPDYSQAYLGGGNARRRAHFAPSFVDGERFWRVVLGFADGSLPSPSEVRSAYHRLAKLAHPDVGGSDERMALINAAFEDAKRELRMWD